MKKWIPLVLLSAITGLGSCLKDNSHTPACSPVTVAAPASETATLKAFLDSGGIIASQDSRGFFYSIDSSASTVAGHPTVCSAVSVTYTGTFLDGTAFDSSGAATPLSFTLSSAIVGWQEAVPLLKNNAVMTLYLPPSLGYGAAGRPPKVPGNAYLIFKIQLLAFN